MANSLITTRLRGWDFCDGQAYESAAPIVFSYSPNGPSDKRQFMKISTNSQQAQQFEAPGEGGILGMGANAIVHRVELQSTSDPLLLSSSSSSCSATTSSANTTGNDQNTKGSENNSSRSGNNVVSRWDAAVKRPFSLSKMLASLEPNSEAGLAKRLRQLGNASLLNSDGRVLYFYGLGVALSSNAYQRTFYVLFFLFFVASSSI